jgi:flagellar L-ring protein FlgH
MIRRQSVIFILVGMVLMTLSAPSAQATSLWSGETVSASSFFADLPTPELRENDIVLILVDEQTAAQTDADTEAEVSDTVSAEVDNWFSVENLSSLWKFLTFTSVDLKTKQNDTTNLPKWGFSLSNEFEGEADTSRNNKVATSIAARVIAVKPNGNVVLEGRRNITVNAETTILTITGIARQEDVSADNTIRSALISELQVAIDGRGVAANANRRGVLSHIFNLLR